MNTRFWIILSILLFFGWGLYADYGVDIARYFIGDSATSVGSAGSWGDTFGAFNGIVSLAGAVFVVRTLILQQEALAEQQKALALQAADSHRQQFEATFFELLKLLRELRSELVFGHSKDYIDASQTPARKLSRAKVRHGTDALAEFILEHLFVLRSTIGNLANADRTNLATAYDTAMTTGTERTFAPYFRLLYSILNRIRQDNILTVEEKNNYARLLRSQLTNVELSALAYNSLSPRSADLETLLTDYRMLKYMPDSPARRRFEGIFDTAAFMPRD